MSADDGHTLTENLDSEWAYMFLGDGVVGIPPHHANSGLCVRGREQCWGVWKMEQRLNLRNYIEDRLIAGHFPTLDSAKAACLLLIAARSET